MDALEKGAMTTPHAELLREALDLFCRVGHGPLAKHSDCAICKLVERIDSALSAPTVEGKEVAEECCWLIERGQQVNQSPPIWWNGGDSRIGETFDTHWTLAAHKARRFSSFDEARAMAEKIFGETNGVFSVTEHVFLAAPALRAQLAAYQAELPEKPVRFSSKQPVHEIWCVREDDYDSLRAAHAGLKVSRDQAVDQLVYVSRLKMKAESTIAELRAKLVEAETSLRWAKHPGQGGL